MPVGALVTVPEPAPWRDTLRVKRTPGDGDGDGEGEGDGDGDGDGEGDGNGDGEGAGLGDGVGLGVGPGVAFGDGVALGVGLGTGLGLGGEPIGERFVECGAHDRAVEHVGCARGPPRRFGIGIALRRNQIEARESHRL